MIIPPPVIEKAALTSVQKRGRVLLGVLVGSWLVIELGVDVLVVVLDGASHLLAASIRFALTLGLFYAVWVGHNWARWLTLGLVAFAFLLSVRQFIIHHTVL